MPNSRPVDAGEANDDGTQGGISAVIVAYRSATHLPRLIADLVAQGVTEIVVVDNASPDDSATVAAAASPRVRVVAMPTNRGYAVGMNAGCGQSSQPLILMINPDVRLEPGCIAALRDSASRKRNHILGPVVLDNSGRLLPTRRSLPSIWSFLGEEVLIPESAKVGGWPQRLWARWQPYDTETDAPLLSGVCLLMYRRVWASVGPLDECYFLYWEEKDWQLRARAKGYPTTLVPNAAIRHARSASTGLHDTYRASLLAISTRYFLERNLPKGPRFVVMLLLATGQALRAFAWSTPPLRARPRASVRRAQHLAWLSAFGTPGKRR